MKLFFDVSILCRIFACPKVYVLDIEMRSLFLSVPGCFV